MVKKKMRLEADDNSYFKVFKIKDERNMKEQKQYSMNEAPSDRNRRLVNSQLKLRKNLSRIDS
jgi:hypothetical protein